MKYTKIAIEGDKKKNQQQQKDDRQKCLKRILLSGSSKLKKLFGEYSYRRAFQFSDNMVG